MTPAGRALRVLAGSVTLSCVIHAQNSTAPTLPPPGRLVNIGVTGFARLCSYDRAGHGWSELGPYPRTMRQIDYITRSGAVRK
jgi:hypothetical protein